MQELRLKEFSTIDLCLATTLSIWFPIERLDRIQDSKKVTFVFGDSKKLQLFLKEYWAEKIQVEPKRFFNSLKTLKGRLYSNE